MGLKLFPDFITHSAEDHTNLLLTSFGLRRVLKGPMMFIDLSWKHRAYLIGIVAHGNDCMHVALKKFIQVLGGVVTDIDTNLGHDLHGHRMHKSCRNRTRTGHLCCLSHRRTQNAFSQVAATTVAGAQNENQGFGHEGKT